MPAILCLDPTCNFQTKDAKFCLANGQNAVSNEVSYHFWSDADEFVSLKGKRYRWACHCSFIRKDSWDYWQPGFDGAYNGVWRSPLHDLVWLPVIFLPFKGYWYASGQFQFGQFVWNYIAVLDENNILEVELFDFFVLVLDTFEYLHDRMAQKWVAAESSPIACLRSVDLRERIRRRMQTGSVFCSFSSGLSFLYALSCHRRSQPMLFSASFGGSSRPFSWKIAATRLRVSMTVLSARGASFCLEIFPWQIATAKAPMTLILCCWESPLRSKLWPRSDCLHHFVSWRHTQALF